MQNERENVKPKYYWITNLTNSDGTPSFFLFHALSLTITTVSVLKEEMKIHYYCLFDYKKVLHIHDEIFSALKNLSRTMESVNMLIMFWLIEIFWCIQAC